VPTTRARAFAQVDVFTAVPYLGNPVAVVIDADGITDEAMAGFAHWTNLSETTFVLPPTTDAADYRLRIFTPGGELPFAGHPTLGSAHAWLAAGGRPRAESVLVQECGAGLVRIRRGTDRLAFAAPPLVRSGPIDADTLDRIVRGLRIDNGDVLDSAWVDNGPGWAGILLASAEAVLALEPDWTALEGLDIGVVGPTAAGADTAVEVRAFAVGAGLTEDPVTGSLNASLAQWLIGSGRLPRSYVAGQGTRLRRAGRVHVTALEDDIWVGGDCVTCITGMVTV
jgi:PhzF family phenazine biosynthesis protein